MTFSKTLRHKLGNQAYTLFITVLLILSSTSTLFSQQLAFPTAEGAGAYTTGGRGGIVVRVTNLNASGTGSLRNALLMTVPRTIVFDVSGRIHMTSLLELGVANSNFTVAGQTAPQGGITISGKPIQMGNSSEPCNNGIWRYIRFRNGSYTGQNDVYNHNGFISNGTNGLILDHCSFSFCDDQAISMDSYYGPLKNITIQRCVFSENSTQIILGLGGTHPRGDMTFSNNLFVDVTHRTPNMGGNLQWDIINNVFFNWGNRLANANDDSPMINHIGNYYKPGDYSSDIRANVVQYPSTPVIYTANNYHATFYPTPQLDDRDMWTDFYYPGQSISSNRFTTTQHQLLGQGPDIKAPQLAYADVTNDVGSNRYLNADGTFGEYQDSFDSTKISNVLNGISSNPSNKSWTQPTLPNNTRSNDYDTDNDGMADQWELNTFGDLTRDSNGDDNGNGYTNLEEFINGITLGYEVIIISDTDTLCEGQSTTLTATGADSYIWNTGETSTTLEVTPNVTTTYTVTGTHSDGSTTQDEITITVNQVPTANAGEDIATCIGSPVTLTASGGDSYQWSNGGTTASITVNPNTTVTYTVEVFENNCSSTDQVTVTVNDIPDVDAGEDQTIFEGETATLTATGADSYVWSTGETTQSITVNPMLDTSYLVTGTTNNCENTDTVTVFLLDDSVNANAGADTEICIGQSTQLTATGGATYLWNTGETTATIEVSPTEITTYTVTAYSPSGNNTAEDSVIVTVNEIPVANAGEDVEMCFGNVTTLTASGGTSYLWNTGETTQIISVSPDATTTYSVEVFENNCSSTDQITVTVNDIPNVDAGENQTIFEGESTTLTATGADTYLWNTGETTQSITVNPSNTTTYAVTGTSNQCEFTDAVTITIQSDDVTANAGADSEICNGESTTLTASGGVTYVWSTGETTTTIEVSPSTTTTYTVTAYSTSGNNTAEDSVTVNVNELPIANAGEDVEICFGNVTTITASGGTSYLWNTGETTQTISVSPDVTSTYSVEVFENNCSSIDDITVTVKELPATDAGNNVSVTEGDSTTLTAIGADAYVWSTGETSASITVSPTSTTTYTVTGVSNGCETSDDVIVSVETENIIANAGVDVAICNGESTLLTATGGATYLWNTGETTASITVSPSQTTNYTVTAFNEAQTASDDDSVTVVVNALPETYAGNDVLILEGDSTTLTAVGADTYIWSTGETTASITVSPTSTTTYTVTGISNGCEISDDVIVSVETENITANAGADVTICNGESTLLTATGGATYLWDTGETTATIEVSPTATTTYTVTAFSSNGNESNADSVIVTVNDIPVANAGNDITICFGNETVLTASGGSTYLWSTGETTQNITVNPNSTTTYVVEVFENNCSSTDDVLVIVNDVPQTYAGNDVTIVEGESTTLSVIGADAYIWNTGETTSSISVNPVETTTYIVTGISNGCESIDEVTVIVEPFIYTASAGANQTICHGYETTLTASEGDSYLWSTGETTQSITVNPTNTQTYTVTVFEGDYQADAEVQVGVNPNPNVVITNGNDVMILEGEFITLSASGANTYAWNNGATQPNIAVSPSTTTTYEVTGFINNCEDTKAVLVNVLEIIEADAGEDLVICTNEMATLTATGGDEYLWSNGETTQSIEVSPNEDTEYSVLVYNALDSDEDSIMVFVEECSTIENPTETEAFEFFIYQDAMLDILKIRIDGLQSVTAKGYSIYDLSGKVVYTELFNPSEFQDMSQMNRELDVSTYSRGIYVVKLIYDDTSLIKKIPIR
ncbi:T9SS type A sorting domain-containing protein [Psychroserpens damuponensis]|uniref:T9SS type A sorting domain-containing protein n=1 Tax=Psychroserpens damuponensis TaxID=943936 RepID=UPI00058DF188|nr:T9SS type A sorting domain-containing protein [Psychroserpens damuponensis]